jgi:hypothetical protein
VWPAYVAGLLCACSVVVPRGARDARTRRLRAAPGFCRLVAVARPLLGRHGYRAPRGGITSALRPVRAAERERLSRIRNSRSNGQRGGHATGGTWHGARSHRPRRKQSYSTTRSLLDPHTPGSRHRPGRSRPPEPVAHDPALLSVSHTVRRIGSRSHRAQHTLHTFSVAHKTGSRPRLRPSTHR